jgi:flavin-dependent dehydrogenase
MQRQRAIVIGASVAGLLAARALRDSFAEVVIVERDALPEARSGVTRARSGVPQGRHLHGLLAAGVHALDALLPDFTSTSQAAGGIAVDVGDFATWYVEGVRLPALRTGLPGLLMERPALEQHLRERVTQDGRIFVRARTRVLGLLGSAFAVHGVRIADDEGEHELHATLVVDASGANSALPTWLKQLGLAAPREERLELDVRYTSCVIRRKSRHLAGKLGHVYMPTAVQPRGGATFALDEERFIVTLMGFGGPRAPGTYAGMLEYARTLGDLALYELLRDSEPLTEPAQLRHGCSLRRRYEEARVPAGVLACGDALCSINPAYGHGMTLAALQALTLRRMLREEDGLGLSRRYFSEAARVLDAPWSLVSSADLEFEGAGGSTAPPPPSVRAYFRRALQAAQSHRDVALAVYRVMHLIEPPSALFAPELVSVVLAHSAEAGASFAVVPEPG